MAPTNAAPARPMPAATCTAWSARSGLPAPRFWPATAAVALMHFVGLYVASALYMGFYMRWVGRHSWVTVVLIALGVPIGSFLVFEKWFLVPMPKGPLEQWLGY